MHKLLVIGSNSFSGASFINFALESRRKRDRHQPFGRTH